MIEQTPGNDIKDYEDLQTGRSEQASSFLEINMGDLLKCSTNNKNEGKKNHQIITVQTVTECSTPG